MRSKRTKGAKTAGKVTVLMLSAVMLTVWAGIAFAEPVNIPMETASRPSDNTMMTLTGVVKVTTLKATIPTTVTFDIDMTAMPSVPAVEDTTAAAKIQKVNPQVGQPDPDVYKITNQPASSVWMYVNEVSVEGDAGGAAPTLVTAYETMFTNPNNVMLTLRDAKGDSTPPTVTGTKGANMKIGTEGTDGDWMVAGSKDYYLNASKRKLVAADQATSVGKENEMGLRIYAYTRKSWQAGSSSKVKPVFAVSVTEPDSATQVKWSEVRKDQNWKENEYMVTRIPCTPFGKKMKIAIVEQDIPQQELARWLGIANSTVSDIIYGRSQCEHMKMRIAGTLKIH